MEERIEIKPSPFAFHGNDQVIYEQAAQTKLSSIRNLFEQRMLTNADGRILYYIDKYTYLNAYLIRSLLAKEMECQPSFCRDRLSHLYKIGLLCRFRIEHKDAFGKAHRTPYFYAFSQRGRSLYTKAEEKKSSQERIPEAGEILRQVAYNQLHIMLDLIYGPNCLNQIYRYGSSVYDGQVSFSSLGKKITFNILTLRTNESWKTDFAEKLKKSQTQKVPCSNFLVLCENELQALEIEKYRRTIAEIATLNICYLSDYATNQEDGIFSHLMIIKPEKNYSSYDICSVPIDGAKRGMPVQDEE